MVFSSVIMSAMPARAGTGTKKRAATRTAMQLRRERTLREMDVLFIACLLLWTLLQTIPLAMVQDRQDPMGTWRPNRGNGQATASVCAVLATMPGTPARADK